MKRREYVLVSLLGLFAGMVIMGGIKFVTLAHDNLRLRESITTNVVYHL